VRNREALFVLMLSLGCGGSTSPARLDAPIVMPGNDAATVDGTRDVTSDQEFPILYSAWPGDTTVAVASAKDAFGANVSGLVYEPGTATSSAVLWAVQNEPSKIHRLVWNGSAFAPVTSDGWTTGKSLRYPNGKGSPDSEGMTRTDGASTEIYVVAERDNDANDVARQSILRYDITGSKGILVATNEWNLTIDLPALEPNSGLEGIAWIPDSDLVALGFFDESRQTLYDPASYPNHGTGVFLVGVDATGIIYGYALDLVGNTFARVATFFSCQVRSVDLFFDRDNGTLWSLCDNACDGHMTLFTIETDPTAPNAGRFVWRASVPPPKPLKDMNNEGFTLAPDTECSNGHKGFFWADDEATGGYALRRGTITCGRLY
jgi:hypothetical protein